MKITGFRFSVTTLIFLLSSIGAFAQFMVLGAKGDNKVDGQPLKVGALLQSNQTITIGNGAYLGLAHTSKKNH